MKSKISLATDVKAKQPFYSKYVKQAWWFDSLGASLPLSILGSVYLDFAMRHSAVIEPVGLHENLIWILIFLLPLIGYAWFVLAPLNAYIRRTIKYVPAQFLLFNVVALIITSITILILPLPDWATSPVLLWCIPMFSIISYLYSSLFLSPVHQNSYI